jgi:hypothetical protein
MRGFGMANDSIERPAAVAALIALLVILVIEGLAVTATFQQPQTPRTTERSLINHIVEELR